ncbi:hypothetical protein [Corynebacterium cystitidis]|uniref:hypothetical protein n=1 Tax=Corynebacterium cystitidis TaxID=35757 RepID=UPI001E5D12CB|nr:hypothetical protein [Corynebacterium cystitidis]
MWKPIVVTPLHPQARPAEHAAQAFIQQTDQVVQIYTRSGYIVFVEGGWRAEINHHRMLWLHLPSDDPVFRDTPPPQA